MQDLRASGVALIAGGAVLAASGAHSPVACPLRTLTGVPCPLCGMTTSVDETFHGHLGAALAANPAGVLAVVLAFAVQLVPRVRLPVPRVVQISFVAGMWLFELHRFGTI